MKYEEAENIVLTAVKMRYCGFAQIRQFFTMQNKRLAYGDLETILERAVISKKLVSQHVGRYSVYCLPGKIPTKVWLDGTGRMGMEFNGIKTDVEILHEENLQSNNSRPRTKLDYTKVEAFTAETFNDSELAEKLGVGRNFITRYKKDDVLFKAAYDRGKVKRYLCADCGKPRSIGSAKLCRECFRKEESPIHAAKAIVDEIIEETESELVCAHCDKVFSGKPYSGWGKNFCSLSCFKDEYSEVEESLVITKLEPPQKTEEIITKNITESDALEIPNPESLPVADLPKTRTVVVEIPLNDYEQMLTIARLKCWDTPQTAILDAIKLYLEVDLDFQRGDYWDNARAIIQETLAQHAYQFASLKMDKMKLLDWLWHYLFEIDRDESNSEIYQLKDELLEFLGKEFMGQIMK